MKNLFRKPVVILFAIVVVALLWAAFRPELLFVNKAVNDPFPTAAASTAPAHL